MPTVIPMHVADLSTNNRFTAQQLSVLHKTLELDPRPHYQDNPQKVYGMPFEGLDIRFHVSQNDVLTVVEIVSLDER